MHTHRIKIIKSLLLIGGILIYLMSMLNFGCASSNLAIEFSKPTMPFDSLIDKNLETYQQNIQNEYEIGLQFYSNSQFHEAIKHFKSAIQLDTIRYNKDVWIKIVDSFQKLGIADSALLFCEKGLKQYPQKIELLVQGVALHEKLEHEKETIEYYQKLIKLAPQSVVYWRKLAHLCSKKDNEAAIQAFEFVLTLDPEDTISKNIQANLLSRTGDGSSVLERMLRKKRQNSGQSQHVFDLGLFYFLKGEYSNAETEFREYLKMEPVDEIGREYLAASLQNQDNYDAAINVYLTILQTDPHHIKSLCEIAYCLNKLEKFDKARDYAVQARTFAPDYGLSYLTLGEIYQKVADKCLKIRERILPDWDDKLIYQMAYEQFQKALNDSLFKSIAETKLQTVKGLIPTKEDWFMHPNDTRAKLKCYEWIYK